MVLESDENLSPEQQELRLLQEYVQETMAQVSGLYERVSECPDFLISNDLERCSTSTSQ